MYQPIYIARVDERTHNLYILPGETIEIEIYPNGHRLHESVAVIEAAVVK